MDEITIKEITWDQILPIWTEFLWPGRVSVIEQTSAMVYMGGIDMDIMKETPHFIGVFSGHRLIGVNSGHMTSDKMFRSRGLYVNKQFRRCGVATMLLNKTFDIALELECSHVWTLPRYTSLSTYERVGFIKCSEWLTEEFDFGPNCYAIADLNIISLNRCKLIPNVNQDDFKVVNMPG
jgi:GNAT superfamily N-acetyltransferase